MPKYHKRKPIVYAIDLDGTLCRGEVYTPKQCLKAKPIIRNINKVNEMYKRKFIVIFTARRDFVVQATFEWLRRNNVMYHAFSNHKMPADKYYDDEFNKL